MINLGALKSVQERIEAAKARANREQDLPVQIVAITKTFPASAIESAHKAGIKNIGGTAGYTKVIIVVIISTKRSLGTNAPG